MLDIAQRHLCRRGKIEISYLQWDSADLSNSKGSNESSCAKRRLLLLHGLADCAMVWSSLGAYLADHYHVVAPDLRGHGESSKPDTGYSSQEIIADLEVLMTHLGWNQAQILGHSWGGKLATIWATQNPRLFSSLILVDPFYVDKLPSWFKITFPLLYRVLPFLQGMGPFANQAAAEKLAQNLKQYRQWTPLQQQAFNATIEAKQDGTWGSKFTIAARNQIFTDVMKQSGLTKPLSIPSLFIQPTKGLNRTQWQLKPYQRYLLHLEIKRVPGNHWAFLVNPDEFNQEVAKFLDQQSIKSV
ncbi:MAG: alpha/beta hydrolase [Xenococcaceae cyanobacterium MO_188.B19]|nr:alpha/beta hydrolase [Xenococcaceae cyanobacterium MO_188.B19]